MTAIFFSAFCASAISGIVPVAAQTSIVVNPNALAVKEQQLLKQHYFISGRGTLADTKSYVIEQPLGRTWQLVTGAWMHWIGALVILGVIAILALAYFTIGPMMIAAINLVAVRPSVQTSFAPHLMPGRALARHDLSGVLVERTARTSRLGLGEILQARSLS